MKLGLGTVQFGLDYGVSNQLGQTSSEEAKAILVAAHRAGVKLLDTAIAYGESEAVLGAAIGDICDFELVSKLPPLVRNDTSVSALSTLVDGSLSRLRADRLYGLLFHDAEDLLNESGRNFYDAVVALKDAGKIQKFGVSVYDRATLERVMDRFPIDLVQVPVNVFDQRLLQDGFLGAVNASGVEVHARSVFLQGLLLMAPQDVPRKLAAAIPGLRALRRIADDVGKSVLELCLGFINGLGEVDRYVCGVNNLAQFEQILSASKTHQGADACSDLACEQLDIINPAYW